MIMNEGIRKSGFSSTLSLVMAVVFLVVGIAFGYVIRGFNPRTKNATMTTPNSSMAGLPANVPIPPGELKRMADEESKPILDKIKSDPKDPALVAQLGDLRFDAGQYKEAITFYKQSLALDPKNATVRSDMADSYAYTGDPDRAISEYQTALQYDPKHGLSLLNLGLVQWHDKDDVKSAVETWEKLIKVNPQFAKQAQIEKLIAKAKEHINMPVPTGGR